MSKLAPDRSITLGRLLFSLLLCGALAVFVTETIHWQWMRDESIMHYVNFLMDHGRVPYRDIIDPNMPGSYFIEGWALSIFGGGDLGWRLYEFLLLGSLIASMIVITLPFDWFAGLFAGVLFVLIHAIDGPKDAVQRDEVMTVLIMAAYAFIFVALRRQKAYLVLPFGLLIGLAASLKPTAAPLGILLLLMAAVAIRRRRLNPLPYVGFGLVGLFAAFAITLEFLLQRHALGAFLDIAKRQIPYYASVGNLSLANLLSALSIRVLIVLLPFAVILTLANTDWKNWERLALAFGVGFGAVSYFAQRKGFTYHRYLLIAFLLVWIGLEFTRAVEKRGWLRGLGIAGILAGVFYVAPLYVKRLGTLAPRSALVDSLQGDLVHLGGANLQQKVQCLDMVSGCIDVLYRLGLVQPTGFISDYMLFPPTGSRISVYDRNMFWQQIHTNPPSVFVMTNQRLMETSSFDKVKQWPEFDSYLRTNYTLSIARDFGAREQDLAYRIYVRNGDPLPKLSNQ